MAELIKKIEEIIAIAEEGIDSIKDEPSITDKLLRILAPDSLYGIICQQIFLDIYELQAKLYEFLQGKQNFSKLELYLYKWFRNTLAHHIENTNKYHAIWFFINYITEKRESLNKISLPTTNSITSDEIL